MNQFIGSRAICTEAMRLKFAGKIQNAIIAPTLRRWVIKETTTGTAHSTIPKERDFPFPVPRSEIKYFNDRGRSVWRINKKYLYLVIAWNDARHQDGELDFRKRARELAPQE